MTYKDREVICRALGTITGVAFVLEPKFASPLFDAVENIEAVFEKAGVTNAD